MPTSFQKIASSKNSSALYTGKMMDTSGSMPSPKQAVTSKWRDAELSADSTSCSLTVSLTYMPSSDMDHLKSTPWRLAGHHITRHLPPILTHTACGRLPALVQHWARAALESARSCQGLSFHAKPRLRLPTHDPWLHTSDHHLRLQGLRSNQTRCAKDSTEAI